MSVFSGRETDQRGRRTETGRGGRHRSRRSRSTGCRAEDTGRIQGNEGKARGQIIKGRARCKLRGRSRGGGGTGGQAGFKGMKARQEVKSLKVGHDVNSCADPEGVGVQGVRQD